MLARLVHNIDERNIQDLQERQIMACRAFYTEAPAIGMHIIERRPCVTIRVTNKPAPPVRVYKTNGRKPWERAS